MTESNIISNYNSFLIFYINHYINTFRYYNSDDFQITVTGFNKMRFNDWP
ncbi:hypothetical protein Cenrod_0102 [Candidatus Symbiobacter mobilis CR]|uniref:Uncharacterized protein n=1 Tax=Candidatus Symbiobacter mobilis CR TaxID=946483 RepID=U5N425_9BURK|nr:hypothetical protein Cenrod_0102 [Candidatus Symbiobacter mobilis CR]